MAPKIVVANKSAQPPVSPMTDGYFRPPQNSRGENDGASSRGRSTEDNEGLRLKYDQAQHKMEKMKKERDSTKKMLLEMSSLVSSLQGISVKYEKNPADPSSRGTNLENLQRKIKAIDEQIKNSVIESGSLREERTLYRSTIEAQENKIKSMQATIDRLGHQREGDSAPQVDMPYQPNNQQEQNQNQSSERDVMVSEILVLKEHNESKYSEIDALERKLEALRKVHAPATEELTKHETTGSESGYSADSSRSSESSDNYQLGANDSAPKIQNLLGMMFKPNQRSTQLEAIDEGEECPSGTSSSFSSSNQTSEQQAADSSKGYSVSYTSSEDDGITITVQQTQSDVSHCTDDFSSCSSGKHQAHSCNVSTNSGWETASNYSSSTERGGQHESIQGEQQIKEKSTKTDESPSTENSLFELYNSAMRKIGELTKENQRLSEDNIRNLQKKSEDDMVFVEEEYTSAMKKIDELTKENKRLRENNSQVLASMAEVSSATAATSKLLSENKEFRKSLEHYKSKAGVAMRKVEELQQEKVNILNELEEERVHMSGMKGDIVDMSKSHKELKELYASLQQEKSDVVDAMEIERVQSSKLAESNNNLKKSNQHLKALHETTAMKLADMADENDTLLAKIEQLKTERSSPLETDKSELQETRLRYSDLKKEHELLTEKVNQLCDQYELLRSKYHAATAGETSSNAFQQGYGQLLQDYNLCQDRLKELEGATPSEMDETLKQEHAEALAKVEALEKSNAMLSSIKGKYDAAEAKVATLEEELERATEKAESAKRKQEKRAEHLRDVIHHYRELEKEHEDVSTRLQSLQSIIRSSHDSSDASSSQHDSNDLELNGTGHSRSSHEPKAAALYARLFAYEGRMKDLEKQRDEALNKMEEIKEELAQAKKEATNATEAKKVRERDLKIVLKYYEELQVKYEEAEARIETLESELADSVSSSSPNKEEANSGIVAHEEEGCNDDEIKESNEDGDSEAALADQESTAVVSDKIDFESAELTDRDCSPNENENINEEEAECTAHETGDGASIDSSEVYIFDDHDDDDDDDDDSSDDDNDDLGKEENMQPHVDGEDNPSGVDGDDDHGDDDNNIGDEENIPSDEESMVHCETENAKQEECGSATVEELKLDHGICVSTEAGGAASAVENATMESESIDITAKQNEDFGNDEEDPPQAQDEYPIQDEYGYQPQEEQGEGADNDIPNNDNIERRTGKKQFKGEETSVQKEEEEVHIQEEEETVCSTYDGTTTLGRESLGNENEEGARNMDEGASSMDSPNPSRPSRERKLDVGNDDDESIQRLMIDVVTLKRRKEQRYANANRDESSPVTQVSTSLSFESAGTAGSELSGSTGPSAHSSAAMSNSDRRNEKSGRDKHVSQLLDELQEATDRVVELEEEQKGAEAKKEILERKLCIARRDAEDAQTRQEAREGNLRDIIAKYKKLEEDYEQVVDEVSQLREELEHARKEARTREEEAKGVRKRLAGCHFHYKKLQDEHEDALQRLLEQERELEDCRLDAEFMEDATKMREFRNEVMADKVRLIRENKEIKLMCNQLIAKLEANRLEPKRRQV